MIKCDVLIIGGGPAGLGAAIETTKRKLRTVIVDENPALGGQLIKQTHKFFGSSIHFAGTRGFRITDELTNEIKPEYCKLLKDHSSIGIFDDDIVGIYDRRKNIFKKVNAKKIIVATGASEKTIPFLNNDLPGIYGAGGVQTLMNVFGVLPGKKILMIGAGNIGLIVSYQLMQAGADIVGIVEAMPKQGGYEVHLNKILRMGVKMFYEHSIVEAIGEDHVEKAVISKIDRNFKELGEKKFLECDTICLAVGLNPSAEILWQSVEIIYSNELGGYIPKHNEYMQTSNDRILVAGDVSGIQEATSAIIEGRIAGITASVSISNINDPKKYYRPYFDYLERLRDGTTGVKVRTGKYKLWDKKADLKVNKTKHVPVSGKIEKDRKKPYVVIECTEDIPCNPCEPACPFDAIVIGNNITNPPVFHPDKCTGCLSCISQCPGLAIFGISENIIKDKVIITIPYEMEPLPEKGDEVWAADFNGNIIEKAVIHSVRKIKNKTNLVSMIADIKYKNDIRYFFPAAKGDTIVCRCLDIKYSEVVEAVKKGYTDFEELKRYLRVTTGPCQGRGCRNIIMGIMRSHGVEKCGSTGVRRPPETSVPFSAFIKRGEK